MSLIVLMTLQLQPAYSANGKIDFVPPGTEERGIAPEFIIWVGGFWAIIENADREIHFFELRGNRFLRAGSAPFPASEFVTEIVSITQNRVRVRLIDDRIEDLDLQLPARRAGGESLSADIAIAADSAFTGRPASGGAVTFKVPGRSQQRSTGGPESLVRFSELSFTLQPILTGGQITGWPDRFYLSNGDLILVWSESQTVPTGTVVRTFVGRFDATGILRSGDELPLWRASVPAITPVAASPIGEVVFLSIEKAVRLVALATINSPLTPAERFVAEARSAARIEEIIRALQDQKSGAAGPESMPSPVNLPSVKRDEIKNILEQYLDVSITPSSTNLSNSKSINPNCKDDNTWLPPDRFNAGTKAVGMAYAWGKFDTPEMYKSHVSSGYLVGNICGPVTYATNNFGTQCPNNANCVVYNTAGIDCSGLVTRAWRLAAKQGTATLPGISSRLANRDELRYGDILLKVGHVMIVEFVRTNPAKGREFGIVESASSSGGVVRRVTSDMEASRYMPHRYQKIVESDGNDERADNQDNKKQIQDDSNKKADDGKRSITGKDKSNIPAPSQPPVSPKTDDTPKPDIAPATAQKRIEIVLKNGRILRVDINIESEQLLRLVSVLERQ